jgi:translocator protein
VLWTYVFFTSQLPLLSFLMIVGMIALTIKSMIEMNKINSKLVYLLVPYVVWFCLAGYLNLYIVVKN